jgi:copper(I)-binding protein
MYYSLNYNLFKQFLHLILMLTFATCTISASAEDSSPDQKTLTNKNEVSIKDSWVRPTRAGQDVGSAYMTFTSQQDTTLVHVDSDVTNSIEIHSMTMKDGIMKMRMLDTLALIAGKPYKLEPGGFHLMLFDLKKQLTEGDEVNFELTFKNKNNIEFKQRIKATVKTVDNKANASDSSQKTHHH